MLSFQKPTKDVVHQFLGTQASSAFTYSAVGATANVPPADFIVDRARTRLGTGHHVFETAKAALQRWDHFQLGWVEPGSAESPIVPGQVVAIAASLFGTWWLNACRIVYVVDETGPISRFGFAYGTLADHAESGEERFLVEWNSADDSVWYDILAFSRPQQILPWLGYPLLRWLQELFRQDSAEAMQRAVESQTLLAAEMR